MLLKAEDILLMTDHLTLQCQAGLSLAERAKEFQE